MSGLSGKTVLVTGASSGIGWAAALAFAGRGCRVGLAARRADKLGALAGLVRARGGEALEIPCDVREKGQARAAVEAALSRWGRLDVLVNNAGILQPGRFESQDLDSIEDILRTNCLGAVYVLHAALGAMRRQGGGHVVNVASIAGLIGLPYMAAYCASKFALVGLTEALRRELRGSGVTLTVLCPGTVDTPMAAASLQDPRLRRLVRPKTAEAVAEKIVQATLRRSPVVIYGEVPAAAVRLARCLGTLADWPVQQVLSRTHPQARK